MKNKQKCGLIALIISAIVICTSCGTHNHDWKGTIEEVDGVTVVKNPDEPLYRNDVFVIEEELEISDRGSDENFIFNYINFLAVDNAENIYVADTRERHVNVFYSNGGFLGTIGRAGQGPGEFGRIRDIRINTHDELVVIDSSQRKMHFFSLGGDFLRSENLGTILGKIQGMFSPRSWSLYFDSRENRYISTAIFDLKKVHFEVLKWDNETNSLTRIASTPEWDPFEGSKPDPDRPAELYCRVMKDDCFLYGYPGTYELKIFDPQGKIIKKITREYEHVPLSEAEKEEQKKAYGADIEIPPYHPAFSYLRTDDEGRIYVQTWEKPTNVDGFFYDVFDHEGKYIAKIPLNFLPRVIKNGKIYTIEEDEEGFRHVKRYKFRWKY
jgi:hypothetical protein